MPRLRTLSARPFAGRCRSASDGAGGRSGKRIPTRCGRRARRGTGRRLPRPGDVHRHGMGVDAGVALARRVEVGACGDEVGRQVLLRPASARADDHAARSLHEGERRFDGPAVGRRDGSALVRPGGGPKQRHRLTVRPEPCAEARPRRPERQAQPRAPRAWCPPPPRSAGARRRGRDRGPRRARHQARMPPDRGHIRFRRPPVPKRRTPAGTDGWALTSGCRSPARRCACPHRQP